MTPEESSAEAFATALSAEKIDFFKICIDSWKRLDFSLNEPELVEQYLTYPNVGVDYLNKTFCSPFSQASGRYSIKFSSIFIHARPKVYRHINPVPTPHSASCEMGDICLIYVHVDSGKNIRYAKAIIAQAKKAKSLDSEDQRLLYDEASGFDYKAKAFYKKTYNNEPSRALPGYQDGRSLGLKYLILESRKRNPAALYSIPWASDLSHTWGASLFRMATGSDGLEFAPGKPNESRWSAILDDLIRMGRGAIPSTSKKPTRRADVTDLDEIIDQFNNFKNYETWTLRANDLVPGGTPMMLMIVQDRLLEVNQ